MVATQRSDLKEESLLCAKCFTGFPRGLKNQGKWEGIFQLGKGQGILNRENETKYWKTREISDNCYLFIFLLIFK